MALRNVLLFNVFGRLSDDLYQTLSAKYEAETRELKTRAAEIQALLSEATTKTQGIQDFTDLVAPYANITELDEELVHTLIEKIIVHEKEIINGETSCASKSTTASSAKPAIVSTAP